jgi:acetyltransferase-like isoleucine patch superfamily enzyme
MGEVVRKIHPTAVISSGAIIGDNVSVGPYSIIYPNTIIGNDTTIGAFCELGYGATSPTRLDPLVIGSNSLIRSHSVFYEGSTFGPGLKTGHRVTVRERTDAGLNLQIGSLCDIQGYCMIGNFVRFHSNVHISQGSVIGDFVWIFGYVVLTNDPQPPSDVCSGVTIDPYVVIAPSSVLLPGVTIKTGAIVGANSTVTIDVEADTLVAGSPAKLICTTSNIKTKDNPSQSAYPWRYRFQRGYPAEVVNAWIEEMTRRPI